MVKVDVKKVLDALIDCPRCKRPIPLREYFQMVFSKLWDDNEFDSKRPFGNSGWRYDVYRALIVAGLLGGVIDDEGYIDQLDEKEGDTLVHCAIQHLFAPHPEDVDL